MELNLFSFIIFSLTTLTIASNFVYRSALHYDKEVIEADPTGKRNITVVKETDFEEQDDNSTQVKFSKHDEIVTSDRKYTDELPGDVVKPTLCSPSPCSLECTDNSECSSDKACLNHKCVDPCVCQCARNANCTVIAHNPKCSCQDRFTGDAFTSCVPTPLSIPTQLPEVDPCMPSPCPNDYWHWCEHFNGTARCACLQDYSRSPPKCIPECTSDSECNADMWCRNSRCKDPCAGYCGNGTMCHVINHRPHCTCLPGLFGNPIFGCYVDEPTRCSPSPCGPNSQCREVKGQAVCRCQKHFMGTPPNCGLECKNNSECASGEACRSRKCVVDPCVNQCAGNGNCRAIAHNGVPLVLSILTQRPEVDPCTPSPCGPNSQCQAFNGNACCTCLPNYIGSPPRCRPECTVNSECDPYMACINNRCSDPCLGVCSNDAECFVNQHVPYCKCPACHFGDPFISCYYIYEEPSETSGGFLERKKKNGWTFDFPVYCISERVEPVFWLLDCPSGSERLNDICVEIDE